MVLYIIVYKMIFKVETPSHLNDRPCAASVPHPLSRREMAEILPIWRYTTTNQSINPRPFLNHHTLYHLPSAAEYILLTIIIQIIQAANIQASLKNIGTNLQSPFQWKVVFT